MCGIFSLILAAKLVDYLVLRLRTCFWQTRSFQGKCLVGWVEVPLLLLLLMVVMMMMKMVMVILSQLMQLWSRFIFSNNSFYILAVIRAKNFFFIHSHFRFGRVLWSEAIELKFYKISPVDCTTSSKAIFSFFFVLVVLLFGLDVCGGGGGSSWSWWWRRTAKYRKCISCVYHFNLKS